MINGRRFLSLHVKLGIIMLAGLLAGTGMFFLARQVGLWAIDAYYMDEVSVHRRNMRHVEDFQAFIDQRGLSSKDSDAIALWSISKQDVYILLYQNQHLALHAGGWGADSEEVPSEAAAMLAENSSRTFYPVSFRDGVFQAVIVDVSGQGLRTLVTLGSICLGGLLFALFILLYNRRITQAIITISQEIQEIGRGNLNFQLVTTGNDELARLVANVEAMRRSLLDRTREEREALEKNSELITAMSHDIRNPLTALMGYLDLARDGQYESPEALQQYLDAGYDKAVQLRQLTDELFRYSLVFGGKELELDLVEYDAQILLDQLLGEQLVMLQQYGFTFQTLRLSQTCRVKADVTYLKRVLDNLMDNLRKYADPAQPVALAAMAEDGWLHLCLTNTVAPQPSGVESNKIGLKTCQRILEHLGGSFHTLQEDGKFSAEILLPIVE